MSFHEHGAAAVSQEAAASPPLLSVMETLNIDGVIIQGHVDKQARVCKIGLHSDVN